MPVFVQSVNMRLMSNESSAATDYYLLKLISEKPAISQRSLADELGLSLGKTNYCLKVCISRGLISVDRFRHSDNKVGYAYFLTPKGIVEKTQMTLRFFHRVEAEYEMLKQEVEVIGLKRPHGQSGQDSVLSDGVGH